MTKRDFIKETSPKKQLVKNSIYMSVTLKATLHPPNSSTCELHFKDVRVSCHNDIDKYQLDHIPSCVLLTFYTFVPI